MKKDLKKGEGRLVPDPLQQTEKRPSVFSAIKGMFSGLSSVLRPNIFFFFWRKKTRRDGSVPGTKKTLTGTWLGQIQKSATAMTIQFA
jgi:hypothetical protein